MNKRQIKKHKKKSNKYVIAMDISNGKDYSVKNIFEVKGGCAKLISSEVLE